MSEEIDRWIKFMKEHPKEWKKIHSQFINAQFDKSHMFIERLSKTESGRKKIIAAYKIRNVNGYPRILKR
ncbi:hypothetical protein J4401_05730 [Candidatus Woesearchaeota archaeon]|nr:hypothetical protein [Candidatus Woesearchaeota archaeon]